jgi:hypothetical protein
VFIYTDIPEIDVRGSTTDDSQVFTAALRSIPAPIQVQWSVQNEDAGDWTPIDVNSEEYRGTTDSLPQPVLVVHRKDEIRTHIYQIEVKNFIGTKTKLIPSITLSYNHEHINRI